MLYFPDRQDHVIPVPPVHCAFERHFQPSSQQVRCFSSRFGFLFQGRSFPAQGAAFQLHIGKQILAQHIQRSDGSRCRYIELFPQFIFPRAILRPGVNKGNIRGTGGFRAPAISFILSNNL